VREGAASEIVKYFGHVYFVVLHNHDISRAVFGRFRSQRDMSDAWTRDCVCPFGEMDAAL